MATERIIIEVQARGLRRVNRQLKQTATQAKRTATILQQLRNALVLVASIRVFAAITADLVNFSDQMLVVKAVTGAVASEFNALRDVAKGLGATTRFTASEAAEGMAFLARAGFNVGQVIGAIPGVLDLAAAAQLDLGNAADIASNLMTSFGLSVSNIPEIMDTLVFTANNANTTVQQLADGLKLFAPIASQLGISLKDSSAAMAVLGDAGIQASLGGTGLRRVITDLEAPTGALAKTLDVLGIGFEEVRISEVGLTGALLRLKEANIGASAASLLFGKRGGFIAAELLRSLGPMGDFREELERIEGTARRVSKEMESGLGGAIRLVRSAFQNLILAFADLGAESAVNQFLRDLAGGLRALARNADDVVATVKVLIAGFVIGKVVAFGAAIFGANSSLRLFIASLRVAPIATLRAVVGFRALGAAMRAIPFVSIVIAITGTIAALVALRDELVLASDDGGNLADVFTTLGDVLGEELTKAVNATGLEFKGFGEIVDAFSARVASGIEGIIATFFGFLAVVKGVFTRISLLFRQFVNGLKFISTSFQIAVNAIANAIGRDPIFENAANNIKAVTLESAKLKEEIAGLDGIFSTFIKGTQAFLGRRAQTTQLRREAERDSAILELALKRQRELEAARPPTPTPAAKPGRTDIAELIRGGGDKAANEARRLTEALRDLEAAHFPLLAAQAEEAEILKIISDFRAGNNILRVDEADLIKRATRARIGANISLVQAQEEQKVLRAELDKTNISLAEFEFLSRKSAIGFLEGQRDAGAGASRAFLKLVDDATNAAKFTDMVMTDAFKSIEDAVISFAETGKFSVNDFFQNFSRQLLRLGTQQAIAGIGGAFQSTLSGQANLGATSGAGAGGIGGLIASFAGSLFPAQRGADFEVGPNTALQSLSGVDNRLIAFRARDGEEVKVTPKNQIGSGDRPIVVNMVINTPDADSFRRSQDQILAGTQRALSRANQRNN